MAEETVEVKQTKSEEPTGNDNLPADVVDETKLNNKDEMNDEDSIYSKPYPNQVSVAKNHPLIYYVDRSRRILRRDETLIVKGRGTTISMACTLVEVLKRQNIAVINKVNTGMDIQSYFVRNETLWTQPAPIIKFELGRGKYATCVSDYHQRKVIEIFENEETTRENGLLSLDKLDELNLPTAFKANDEQMDEANEFLINLKKETDSLDLPNFIKYASILIHPLLKDKVFKDVLRDTYKIDDDTKKDHHDDSAVEVDGKADDEDDNDTENID